MCASAIATGLIKALFFCYRSAGGNKCSKISCKHCTKLIGKYKERELGVMLSKKKEKSSKLFVFLPSNTNGKEKINQHKWNAIFHASDIDYDSFKEPSPSASQFNPIGLKIPGEKTKIAREIVVESLKMIAKISNSNLIKNNDHLLSKMSFEPDVQWVGKDKIMGDSTKYNMSY